MFGLPRGRRVPHSAGFALAGHILVVNPGVGFFKAGAQGRIGLPIEILLDESVVAIAAVDALGSAEVVISFEFYAGDAFHDVHQLIDADRFGRTEIDGLEDLRIGDQLNAFDTIVGEHEAASLFA